MRGIFGVIGLSLLLAGGALSAVPVRAQSAASAAESVAHYGYRVVKVYPHDPDAFTQGLFIQGGRLFESTGMPGTSSLREVDLTTGTVKRKYDIGKPYFAEGIAPWGDRIIGLTWQHGKAFVWDAGTFAPKGEFSYEGEGWGLATDGESLILSDGTDRLRFMDPDTFKVRHEVPVTLRGRRISMLNELEYINGSVFANVWQTNYILRINPADGKVDGVIDLTGLMSHGPAISQPVDVLNGIAFDPVSRHLLVTGKYWPALFEIELIDKATGQVRPFK
ncbi:MAG: glutaminyl-peptide cyclotransferase [Asticcacaulis sp.]